MKRPWLAYVVTALVAAAAGLAIAGVPSTPAGTTVEVDPTGVTNTVPVTVPVTIPVNGSPDTGATDTGNG